MHNLSTYKCIKCGKELCNDDIGITKKLINRASTEFMCIHCIAEYFGVSEELIRKKIEEYRAYGCSLFTAKTP
jgi:DNA-directed RNA polymerase subunit RPC12/RpoP